MATVAYRQMENPVVVEKIKADYGLDIGDTLIGMHLKHVAVPVRASLKNIGGAHITVSKNEAEVNRRRAGRLQIGASRRNM